jgi:hypothetical protein
LTLRTIGYNDIKEGRTAPARDIIAELKGGAG